MFIIVISSVSDHFILISIARPCFRLCVWMFAGAIKALFTMKATPADSRGFIGLLESMMSKFLLKRRLMSPSLFSSRCVSCSASIAIFSVLVVLFIIVHLSMRFMPCVGAAAPFRLRFAIFMFTRFLGVTVSVFPWCGVLTYGWCAWVTVGWHRE
jgi:hypothetical protein